MITTYCKYTDKMYSYLALYLVSMHLLVLGNVLSTGSQVSTIVLDLVGGYSFLVTLLFLAKKLCSADLNFTILETSVISFLAYSVFSIVLYLVPANPASINAFLYGVHLLILPTFLFFAVRSFDLHYQEKTLRLIVYLHVFMAVVGLVLFIWRPEFYTNNLKYQFSQQGIEELWQLYARLNSYMGSTATGILSAITIALLPMVGIRASLKYLFLILFLVTVLLTQQRGAYITAVISLLVFISHQKRYRIRGFLFLSVLSIIGIIYLSSSANPAVSTAYSIVYDRITKDLIQGDYHAERGHSFAKGLAISAQFPMGMGAGATTSAADDAGANPLGQVVDSNYMRIACDLGYIGLALFLVLILTGVYSVISRKKNKQYLLILFIYVFQANFTNVFDVFYVNHIFWIFLGLINAGGGPDHLVSKMKLSEPVFSESHL